MFLDEGSCFYLAFIKRCCNPPECYCFFHQNSGGREAINLCGRGSGWLALLKWFFCAKWGMVDLLGLTWICQPLDLPLDLPHQSSNGWLLVWLGGLESQPPPRPGWAASTTQRRGLETPWTSEETSEHVGLSENRVYSPWNSHLIGIMIIDQWVYGYTIFRHTHVESWIPNLWVEISWWNVMFPCQYYKMESMRMLNIKVDGHSNLHILLVPYQTISFAIFTVHPWVTWYL